MSLHSFTSADSSHAIGFEFRSGSGLDGAQDRAVTISLLLDVNAARRGRSSRHPAASERCQRQPVVGARQPTQPEPSATAGWWRASSCLSRARRSRLSRMAVPQEANAGLLVWTALDAQIFRPQKTHFIRLSRSRGNHQRGCFYS